MPSIKKLPVVKSFHLESLDDATVEIIQARRGENERRDGRYDEVLNLYGGLTRRYSLQDVYRFEVYMTLVSCNITFEEDGEPMFKFKDEDGRPAMNMTELAFNNAWGCLPNEVADEIIKRVHEVNIHWDLENQGEAF